MQYFNILLLVFFLFILTCVLCVLVGLLLEFNPFCTLIFLLVGSLSVVLAVDLLQAHLFG